MKTNDHRIITGVTLFLLLCFFAPLAQARPPRAREMSVTVQSIQTETRTLVVTPTDKGTAIEYVWNKSTQFIEDSGFVDASAIKAGMHVKIYYHTPFFGKPYVSKVVWQTANQAPLEKKTQ